MGLDGYVLLAILAMAVTAYGTRALGIGLIAATRIPSPARAFLRNAPGAIIVAIVVPVVVRGGVPLLLGAAVTAAVAVRTRNLLWSVLSGVATVGLLQVLSPWIAT